MIIGICGKAWAGKGAVARALVLKHGFTELAFADPIYEAISVITGYPVAALKNRDLKETPLPIGASPRKLLQTLGTEWGRNTIRDDIWVAVGLQRAELAGGNVCFSDVRFENEAQAIIEAGGAVWRVERQECDTRMEREALAHSSEAGVPDRLVEKIIKNNGTIGDLDSAVARLLGDIMVA